MTIENGRRASNSSMKIIVYGNNIVKAIGILNKKLKKDGLFRELKERSAFQTNGERRRIALSRAKSRERKAREKTAKLFAMWEQNFMSRRTK